MYAASVSDTDQEPTVPRNRKDFSIEELPSSKMDASLSSDAQYKENTVLNAILL